jgi:hypothetical protein
MWKLTMLYLIIWVIFFIVANRDSRDSIRLLIKTYIHKEKCVVCDKKMIKFYKHDPRCFKFILFKCKKCVDWDNFQIVDIKKIDIIED